LYIATSSFPLWRTYSNPALTDFIFLFEGRRLSHESQIIAKI
jgi:hypothetical protein